jgi:hypothetical protein
VLEAHGYGAGVKERDVVKGKGDVLEAFHR